MPAAVAWRWIWRRPAALSAPGRVLQISGAFSSSRSPSAQATTEAAAWRSPTPTPTWWPAGLGQARQFGTAKHRQPEKQHLYLVLDDNPNGFNIHKLDMDNDLDDAGCGSAESPLCLPDPPILQVGPPTIRWHTKFAAMGSHIIGICPSEGTLLFDTKKSTLAMSTVRPDVIITMDGYEAAIAVGNKLYVFESFSHNDRFDGPYFPGGFHCLAADLKGAEKDWTWKPLSCDSPFRWSWNKRPPEFPIIAGSIYAHVVHPRTGTIFLSAFGQPRPRTHIWGDGRWGTFAYASKGRGQWKRLRGDWLLPFNGPGHYDHVLGAWVGLYLGRPPVPNVFVSFLCACPVMSGWQQPQWIVGRQKLSWDDPRWMSTLDDVKLIRMAKRGEYCLLERLLPQGEKDKMKYVIRLTTFAVKYGENGELTTMAHRPPRFYQAPSYHHRFDMQAFWM